MWTKIIREWYFFEDLLKFYFWVVGVPYILQWLAVDLLS